jgi:CheY-like chemotaxis protein
MPIMDSYEAAQQIRQREGELDLAPTPIIFTSGITGKEHRCRALAAAILSNPYKVADLSQMSRRS